MSDDFEINLQRTYPEDCPCAFKDSEGEEQSFDIPVVFNVKPKNTLTDELTAFAEKHPDKVALASAPVLWVALKSVDLSNLNVKSNGKKVPKHLWLDAVVLDPMLSAAVYRQYTKTIVGNVPSAT